MMSRRKIIKMALVMFVEDSYPFCASSQQSKTRDNTPRDASGS
jgi:hypothetical protein